MIRAAILTASLALAGTGLAADPADEGTVRLREGKKNATLQTADISLKNEAGVVVDLIGAIHIADASYYKRLNKAFKKYDTVLFELVGGDGNVIETLERPPDKNNAIRFFQVLLKNALQLEFQIDAIDYSAPNFVHADMTAKQFAESTSKDGQSLQNLMERAFKAQVESADTESAEQATEFSSSLMGLFGGETTPDQAKLVVARQLQHMEGLIEKMEGEDGTVILSGRNQVAIDKLLERLATDDKKIAIFYGAAHLDGIEKALVEKHGFKRTGVSWRKAWKITKQPKTDTPSEEETTESAASQ